MELNCHQIEKCGTFFRSVFMTFWHFCAVCKNFLKTNLQKLNICPIWGQFDPNYVKIWDPWLKFKRKTYQRHGAVFKIWLISASCQSQCWCWHSFWLVNCCRFDLRRGIHIWPHKWSRLAPNGRIFRLFKATFEYILAHWIWYLKYVICI